MDTRGHSGCSDLIINTVVLLVVVVVFFGCIYGYKVRHITILCLVFDLLVYFGLLVAENRLIACKGVFLVLLYILLNSFLLNSLCGK
jgi:hypothetical protein